MSQEKTPLELIEEQLEEKNATLESLQKNLMNARNFIQQNEPKAYALSGAIEELNLLKGSLTPKPQKREVVNAPEEPKKEEEKPIPQST
jgi:hypothetical protein